MAYPTITPRTSMPAVGADADGVELVGYDTAEVYVGIDTGGGSGTACLIQRGPGDKWRQYGPTWPVDDTQAGQQPARIAIPRKGFQYQILVTGGPTLADCYLFGGTRGR